MVYGFIEIHGLAGGPWQTILPACSIHHRIKDNIGVVSIHRQAIAQRIPRNRQLHDNREFVVWDGDWGQPIGAVEEGGPRG